MSYCFPGTSSLGAERGYGAKAAVFLWFDDDDDDDDAYALNGGLGARTVVGGFEWEWEKQHSWINVGGRYCTSRDTFPPLARGVQFSASYLS